MLLQKLLKHLPGGEKLTQWSEAAPYLLTIVVATHHAFFGHIDLMILGGYTLATWLTERLSNEVAVAHAPGRTAGSPSASSASRTSRSTAPSRGSTTRAVGEGDRTIAAADGGDRRGYGD